MAPAPDLQLFVQSHSPSIIIHQHQLTSTTPFPPLTILPLQRQSTTGAFVSLNCVRRGFNSSPIGSIAAEKFASTHRLQHRAGHTKAKRGKHKRWWLLPLNGPPPKKREREKIDERRQDRAHLGFSICPSSSFIRIVCFFDLLLSSLPEHPPYRHSFPAASLLPWSANGGTAAFLFASHRCGEFLEAAPALNSAPALFLRHNHCHLHRLHSFIHTFSRRFGRWSPDRLDPWTSRAGEQGKARSGRASTRRSAFSASLTTLSERPLSVSRSLTLPWHILGHPWGRRPSAA